MKEFTIRLALNLLSSIICVLCFVPYSALNSQLETRYEKSTGSSNQAESKSSGLASSFPVGARGGGGGGGG